MKTIGVLALQGAISEHQAMLRQLDVNTVAVKSAADLTVIDGLIIPGGESTVISRLIDQNALYSPIIEFAQSGKAVFGTCAGLILLSRAITDTHKSNQQVHQLGLIDVVVERNGFGRQIDSFEVDLNVEGIGNNIPAVFIRAPYIQEVGSNVHILAEFENKIVAARENNILVTAFHPELTNDLRVMDYFVKMV